MKMIFQHISNHDAASIKRWLDDLEQGKIQLSPDFDWWRLYESLSRESFRDNTCNSDILELAIEVHGKTDQYSNDSYNDEFSPVYLVVRALRLKSDYNSSVINSEFVLSKVKSNLDISAEDLSEEANDWRSLIIEKIRYLGRMKNWIRVILELQDATGDVYSEFTDYLRVRNSLP